MNDSQATTGGNSNVSELADKVGDIVIANKDVLERVVAVGEEIIKIITDGGFVGEPLVDELAMNIIDMQATIQALIGAFAERLSFAQIIRKNTELIKAAVENPKKQ